MRVQNQNVPLRRFRQKAIQRVVRVVNQPNVCIVVRVLKFQNCVRKIAAIADCKHRFRLFAPLDLAHDHAPVFAGDIAAARRDDRRNADIGVQINRHIGNIAHAGFKIHRAQHIFIHEQNLAPILHQPLRIIEPLGNRRPFGGRFAGQRHFARAHLAAVLAVGGDQENPVVPRDRIAHRNVHIRRAQRVRAGVEKVQLAEPDHRGTEHHGGSVYGKTRFDLRKIPVVQRHGAHVQLAHALKAGFVIANDDLFQRAAEVFKDRAALVESEPLSDHVRAAVQHEPRLFARGNGQPVRIQRASAFNG